MTNTPSFQIKKIIPAALIMGCLFLLACENKQKEIEVWTKDKLLQEEATQVETLISQNGRLKARLTAPLMLRVMAGTNP